MCIHVCVCVDMTIVDMRIDMFGGLCAAVCIHADAQAQEFDMCVAMPITMCVDPRRHAHRMHTHKHPLVCPGRD